MPSTDRSTSYRQPATYRQDDVHEILRLAIAHQAQSEDLSREQLFEIGDELGISVQEMMMAEQEWQQQKPLNDERQAFLQWRQVQFRQHRTRYFIVNGFLLAFDWLTFGDAASGLLVIGSHALSFSLYVALIWGLFLTLEGWQTRQTEGKAFEKGFRSWQRRQWLSQSVRSVVGRLFSAT